MFRLALGGIALGAAAVGWWNGRRTQAVQAEVDRLQARLDAIRAADAQARQAMAASYMADFLAVVRRELAGRDQVATELTRAHAAARDIMARRFGSREQDGFRQAVLELELALGRLHAERAWLHRLLDDAPQDAPAPQALPSAGDLLPPDDFPREGGLVHLDTSQPAPLHGYRLALDEEAEDAGGDGGNNADGSGAASRGSDRNDHPDAAEPRALLYRVDHQRRTARASSRRGALLQANLLDAGEPLRAVVQGREHGAVRLRGLGTDLLLPTGGGQRADWLHPEAAVEVWPDNWTLAELIAAGPAAPLPVRLHPRVAGTVHYWAPIALSVRPDHVADLVEVEAHFSEPQWEDAPWQIHPMDDGRLAFSMGQYSLVAGIDAAQRCFVLHEIARGLPRPEASVRCHAGLAPFLSGSEDDRAESRSRFADFVQALYAELASQQRMLRQRRMALRLRKLSLIYQDQQEHLLQNGHCGFLPGEAAQGGRTVVGTLVELPPPAWLQQQIAGGGPPRLRAAGLERGWPVRRITWEDARLGLCRLELDAPQGASFHDIAPFELRRIELAGEGAQQQTLSQALEKAIGGCFASGAVHDALLGLDERPVAGSHFGRDAALSVLRSDQPVAAVWGPPGTGKTTLMVDWLLSLFPPGQQAQWPRVLIAAPTHVAVTKLLADLLAGGEHLWATAVRYGSEDRVAGTPLEPIWHRRLLQALHDAPDRAGDAPHAGRWRQLLAARDGREAATRWLLGSRRIHAATCVGLARADYGLAREPFDIAVIDEAGKAFGAELMLPASLARRVVLVGDHNQLPPTVTTDALDGGIGYRLPLAEVEALLRHNFVHDLYERLPAPAKGMLTLQYRMHADIGALVSRMFYDSRLDSDRLGGAWALTARRLVFADFSAMPAYRHRRPAGSQSLENATERAALHTLLYRLKQRAGRDAPGVLVICPYQAQQEAIQRELAEHPERGLQPRVSTVDAEQGGQADVVILLMTRSSGNVEFLLDRHRLNVALSRAREAVIVLGHLQCLGGNGEGPVAELVRLGREAGVLELVRLPEQADFRKTLAPRVVP